MEFSKKSRVLILLFLVAGSIISYAIGFRVGFIAAIVLGLVLETCFWIGLFRIKSYWSK